MAEKMTILSINNLGKTYRGKEGAVTALDGLSLEVAPGEIIGLLGPNGAGKTTAVKMIMGFLSPSSGEIVFKGKKLSMTDSRQCFGYLPESFKPNPNLTVYEYIEFQSRLAADTGPGPKQDDIYRLLGLVGMDRFPKRRISDLSKGMGQRVGLAQAFAGNPDFMILDEPTSGLDPLGRREVINLLIKMKEEGRTIFFCSHILSEVERLCDRIGILVDGKLRFMGAVEEFRQKWGVADLDEGFIKEVEA